MKTRLGRQTKGSTFLRWFFFVSAVIGVLILTSFTQPEFQVLGWGISTVSCLGWVMIAIQDRDIPRALMESMYAIIGVWGFINWLN